MEKINLTDFQKRKFSNCFIAVYVVTKDIKIRTVLLNLVGITVKKSG